MNVTAPGFDPLDYHLDLRGKAGAAPPSPAAARALLDGLTGDPLRANPVSIVQAGLGALALGEHGHPLVAGVAAWIERTADERGLLPYRFPMPHTFPLEAPWYSALAQGEAASLLVRAALVLDRSELFELADRVAEPLLDPGSDLVAETAAGPVLQEYPTNPPAHVLNGWLLALWGLYDVANAPRPHATTPAAREAAAAFAAGSAALAERIDLYRTRPGWSLYDLYPHPLANVASPFYHRLHVVQLRRQQELAPDPRLGALAAEWGAAVDAPARRAVALARKVAFRAVRPRWRRIRPPAAAAALHV
jgi:hypothetical protein